MQQQAPVPFPGVGDAPAAAAPPGSEGPRASDGKFFSYGLSAPGDFEESGGLTDDATTLLEAFVHSKVSDRIAAADIIRAYHRAARKQAKSAQFNVFAWTCMLTVRFSDEKE